MSNGSLHSSARNAAPVPIFDAAEGVAPACAARVAHVVLTLQPGGLERLVCDLAHSSKETGAEAIVYCLDTDGALAPGLRRAGIDVHLVRRNAGLDPGLVLRLADRFRRERLTVVHTHGPDPMFYGGWAAWLARVPVRVHTQHDTMLESGGWRERLKFRLASAAFNDIVAVSGKTREIVARYRAGLGRLWTIPNGIDEHRFKGAAEPGDTPLFGDHRVHVVGTVARLAPEKALDRLIDAFSLVSRLRPSTRLVIVGDGPERERLEAQVDRLRLAHVVSFLGHRDDVAGIVRGFDTFVLSSTTEGIPLALLEAMGSGVAVVATAVGGVPEVVTHEECGILVPAGDPRAMLEAIVDLVDHRAKRERLGSNAAARVQERFSLSRMAAAYRAIYRGTDATRWWLRPARRLLEAALPRTFLTWRGSARQPEIALTLDDGPDPLYTPRILDLLRDRGVRATFFLVGAKAARYPDLVQRIADEGHELGNHSFHHPDFGILPFGAARQEIADTRRVLRPWLSASTRPLFRPPYGTLSAASTLGAWLEGHTVVLWNVDFKDFQAASHADIGEQVARWAPAPGDVILYHGHSPAALAALPDVLAAAQRSALALVPVSKICAS